MPISMKRSFVVIAAMLLSACSGGSSDPWTPGPGAPTILQFDTDRSSYFVGDKAKLTVRYSGGTGRIEPVIGTVSSGTTVETPPLEFTTQFELVVQSAQGTARRRLTVSVAYRDRYRKIAAAFPIASHSAVLAADGSVLVIGGSRGLSTISDSIDRFDPRTERFTKVGSLAGGPVLGETATRLTDGRILVAGGIRMIAGSRNSEIVDEVTGAATATGATKATRLGHAAALVAGNRVLLTGGYTNEGFADASPTAEIWHPATGEFRLLQSRMLGPRAYHTATSLDDGRVLIVGGLTGHRPYIVAEIFDPATETFTAVPSNEQAVRGLHDSIKLSDGNVLVMGGENESSSEYHRSVLLWSKTSGVFETMPNLLAPRSLVRAVATRLDQVLLFGGATHADPRATATAEGFTRTIGSLPLPPMPVARAWHTVTRLNDGPVLIVGGEDAQGALIADVLLYE